MAHAFNPSSQEAEERECLLVQDQISLHSKVPGQPELHSEICHGKGRGARRNEGKKAATIPPFTSEKSSCTVTDRTCHRNVLDKPWGFRKALAVSFVHCFALLCFCFFKINKEEEER